MMSDLQTKLGGGLNILQDGLQQGKQKLQNVQEASQLKKNLQETSEQRASLMIKLGEEAYKMVRRGSLLDDKLVQMSLPLLNLDVQAYQVQQALEELHKASGDGPVCKNCGNQVTELDKFCGSCGSQVENEAAATVESGVQCEKCNANVPHDANFCGCCGTNLA